MLSGPRAAGSLAHLRKRLIDGEARRLLPGRKLLEHLRRLPAPPTASVGSVGGDVLVSCRATRVSLPSPRPLPIPPPGLQGREGRASRRGVVPPAQVWELSCILRSTSSRLKLAAFWRCGYSLNVCRNSPTKACAGTSRKT